MKYRVLLAFAAACLVSAAGASAADIDLPAGKVLGLDMADGSTIYYGLPYAEAPEGALRWKPPVARKAWQGILDATRPAPACVQGDTGWNAAFLKHMREDCLSVSIRTPNPRDGARLPVLVYIHGGSNAYAGAGSLADDAIHRDGIVLVKVQYRLGVFGFLGLDALRRENANGSSGNYALLDLIESLRWIKTHIAQFGGDPDNVTISGNSAGALDALWLMLSSRADGLYHKVILQAAAPGAPRTAKENEAAGDILLDRLKLPHGAKGLSALRDLPADLIVKAARDLPTSKGVDPSFFYEQQILDGYVMTAAYAEAFARGAGRGVPVLIGSNHQELGSWYKPDTVPALLSSAFGHDAAAARAMYTENDPLLGSLPTQIVTDMWFRCPVNWLSEQSAARSDKVWRYEFGFGAPGSGKPPEHTSEMNYIYHAAPTTAEAGAWPPLQRYWANFMRTGDPNGAGLPAWPAYGTDAGYLDIRSDGLKAGKAWRRPICDLMFQGKDFPRSAVVPK